MGGVAVSVLDTQVNQLLIRLAHRQTGDVSPQCISYWVRPAIEPAAGQTGDVSPQCSWTASDFRQKFRARQTFDHLMSAASLCLVSAQT